MKLVAYSLVPSSPMQYMHLGYTAAATKVEYFVDPIWSAAAFVVTLLLIAALTMRRSVKWGVIILCVAVVTACWAGANRYSQTRKWESWSREWTQNTTAQILTDIQMRRDDGKGIPGTMAEYKKECGGWPAVDAWQHPWRVTQHKRVDGVSVTVTSAGPDGRFDTADDISNTRTIPLPADRKPAHQGRTQL